MARTLLRAGRPHRFRAAAVSGAIAIGVLVVAFGGGALSGKLEHRPTYHGTGVLPPVATTAPPTTDAVDPATLAMVQQNVTDDMSLDVLAQRLDPSLSRRAALAITPGAIAARHADIALAWAPDKVATIEAQYDQIVENNARDQTAPSVTNALFVVTTWSLTTVNGTAATAVLLGHYELTESATVLDQTDKLWTIVLSLSAGRWRIENRTAT